MSKSSTTGPATEQGIRPPSDPFDAATAQKRPRIGSHVASVLVFVLLAKAVHFAATNPAFQWPVVWEFFTSRLVLQGLANTLYLTVVGMVLGILGGMVLAAMRLSRSRLLSWPSATFVWVLRSVPLLVQLIFWFNLAALLPRISISIPFGPELYSQDTNVLITPLVAAIVGLSLHEMAYMAEIIRAGVLSVPDGQIEAAHSLGMNRYQLLRRVYLPQASRIIVPPTGSQVITMLKATSLVSVIAMRDLLYTVQEEYNRTFQVIPLLTVACLWYLAVTSILALGQMYVERRLGRGYGKQGSQREEGASTESPQIDLKITDRLS